MAKNDDGLSFNGAETEALKSIVADWLNEELLAPPFDKTIQGVLKKLGLASPKSPQMSSMTLERLSEHAAMRPLTSASRQPPKRGRAKGYQGTRVGQRVAKPKRLPRVRGAT